MRGKEITAGTLKKCYRAIKLFCDINEIDIQWKKITKGIPRPKKYADDRYTPRGLIKRKNSNVLKLIVP